MTCSFNFRNSRRSEALWQRFDGRGGPEAVRAGESARSAGNGFWSNPFGRRCRGEIGGRRRAIRQAFSVQQFTRASRLSASPPGRAKRGRRRADGRSIRHKKKPAPFGTGLTTISQELCSPLNRCPLRGSNPILPPANHEKQAVRRYTKRAKIEGCCSALDGEKKDYEKKPNEGRGKSRALLPDLRNVAK